MKYKGTKGKWDKILNVGNSKDEDCFYKIIKDCNDNTIAEVKGVHCGIDNNECEYNTILISKAPEMLGMLIDLTRIVDGYLQEQANNDSFPSEIIDKNEDAKQLIKQATKL